MEVKIAELAGRVTNNEEKINDHIDNFKLFQKETKEHFNKLDDEVIVIHRLAISIEQLAENITKTNDKIDKLSSKQDEMGNKISNLEHAPAKRMFNFTEDIKNNIWKLIIVGAICYFLGGLLPFPIG